MFKVLIFACIVAYAAATTPLLAAPFFAAQGLSAPFAYGRPPHPLAYSHLAAPLALRNIETPTAFTAYSSISTPEFQTHDIRGAYRPLTSIVL